MMRQGRVDIPASPVSWEYPARGVGLSSQTTMVLWVLRSRPPSWPCKATDVDQSAALFSAGVSRVRQEPD